MKKIHQWRNDQCMKCKAKRRQAQWKRATRERPVLINGVWEDRPVYEYGRGYAYSFNGKDWTFERPNCKGLIYNPTSPSPQEQH